MRLRLSARGAFFAALLIVTFLYGFATARWQIFPYAVFDSAREAAADLAVNWRSLAGLRPSRWLAPSLRPGAGVVTYRRGEAAEGATLVSSWFDGDVALRLLALDGTVVHQWTIRYRDLWTKAERKRLGVEPLSNWDVGVMGAVFEPDGHVLFTFNNGGIVRMDKCGRVDWKAAISTHHSIFVGEDGTYWVPSVAHEYRAGERTPWPIVAAPFLEDSVVQLSSSGRVLREFSIVQLMLQNHLEALLLANGVTATANATDDYTHLNKVAVLTARDAAAFPMFRAGDVLVSLRNLNLLFVFEPDTRRIVWHRTGPWLRQHDPDFDADGRISVFDNRTDNDEGRTFGGSRILAIDPASLQTEVLYAGSAESPFYSSIEGEHVRLANGDLLISEAARGRIFEVNGPGKIVWEYVNRYDDSHVIAETHAYARVPPDVIAHIDWAACPAR